MPTNEERKRRIGRTKDSRTPLQMALSNASNALDLTGFEIGSAGYSGEQEQKVLDAWDYLLDACKLLSTVIDEKKAQNG